ncbi:hypothetical protein P5V15_006277 [Pogonomyrmex californicus]
MKRDLEPANSRRSRKAPAEAGQRPFAPVASRRSRQIPVGPRRTVVSDEAGVAKVPKRGEKKEDTEKTRARDNAYATAERSEREERVRKSPPRKRMGKLQPKIIPAEEAIMAYAEMSDMNGEIGGM